MARHRSLVCTAVLLAAGACSAKPVPFAPIGIEVSAPGDRCLLALHGKPIGDLDDFQTKLKLKAALPHQRFSTGIRAIGNVPSGCIQKVYEVLRAAHVQTVGVLAEPGSDVIRP